MKHRPYQAEAITNVLNDLHQHDKLGIIMPTGAGKTEIFLAIAKRFVEDNPKLNVLILSHLSILTQQTAERAKTRVPEIPVGVLQADKTPDAQDRIIIGTMQTAKIADRINFMKHRSIRDIGLIIIDEAHYLYTESYDTALSHFPKAKVIGATATPFRDRALMTNWFDKVSVTLSLQDLIDQGYLVKPNLNVIKRASPETTDIMAQVLALYKQLEPTSKAIVYMQTIEDADQMRNCFIDVGVKASSITSNLTGSARDEALERFTHGDTMVLTNCNVLSAGFDAPCTSAIFMPYATSSPVLYMQRIGRGLRTAPGKTQCNIYAFGSAPQIANRMYEDLQERVLQYDGTWKETNNVFEDLRLNEPDPSSEIYTWTKTVCDTVTKMKKYGMETLASYLEVKDFPPKFLRHIGDLLKRIPDHKPTMPGAKNAASEKQLEILLDKGFRPDQVEKLTKGEASQMISVILHKSNANNPWIIPSGMYQGKHISELPHAYRTYVLKKFPTSDVARLINMWRNEQRSQP